MFSELKTPIPSHPTWDIVDVSKMKTYVGCRRKFFYRYVLGWAPVETSYHLVYGEAVHRAMAVIMKNWHRLIEDPENVEIIREASAAFTEVYREGIPPDAEDGLAPKTPSYALTMLVDYVQRYALLDKFTVLYTETAGTVPVGKIGDHLVLLHFRMDTVVDDPNRGVVVLEHKTVGRISQQWIDGFKLAWQPALYTHALNCLFGRDRVWGTEINGLCTGKVRNEFVRVPVRLRPEVMSSWISEVIGTWGEMAVDFEVLSNEDVGRDTMTAFPRTGAACDPPHCTAYYRTCPYMQFCVSWGNPLQHCQEEVPLGFKREWWDPSEYERRPGITTFNLEKDGSDEAGDK